MLTVDYAIDVHLKRRKKEDYLIKLLTVDCAIDVHLKRRKKEFYL